MLLAVLRTFQRVGAACYQFEIFSLNKNTGSFGSFAYCRLQGRPAKVQPTTRKFPKVDANLGVGIVS